MASPVPTKFNVLIFGGECAPVCSVSRRDEDFIYSYSPQLYSIGERTKLEIARIEWQAFWETLDSLGAWEWEVDYSEGVIGAGRWSVEMEYAERLLHTRGDILYPPSGIACAANPTWRAFCSALSQLAGGRPVGCSDCNEGLVARRLRNGRAACGPRQARLEDEAAFEPAYLPERLEFRIGDDPGPFYEVWLWGDRLYYSGGEHRYGRGTVVVDPSAEEWKAFWRVLDSVRIWEWAPRYDDSNVLDGTPWLVELQYDGRALSSKGYSSYPPGGGTEATFEWRQFCHAVRRLIGNREFGAG